VNAFLWAATALLAGLVPCGFVCVRSDAMDGVVALELAGATVVLALLALAEGFQRSIYFNVALIAAGMAWVGGLVFARFFGRWL
jgi:multicomponent Na+:H+ antiporter subunit F